MMQLSTKSLGVLEERLKEQIAMNPESQERPSNVETLEFIKRDQARQDAQTESDTASKVVEAGEMERRRQAMIRATEIVCKRLAYDAAGMEEVAISPGLDLNKRHQLFDTAKGLRITIDWLTEAQKPAPTPTGG